MKRKSTAAFIALILAALPFAGMPVSAEALPPDWQPPEWVPTDFASALDFYGTYGETMVKDGMVCIVSMEPTYDNFTYELEFGGTVTDWVDWCDYPTSTYELEIPEAPEDKNSKEYQEYEEKLGKMGLNPRMLENDPDFKAPFRFTVRLYDTIPDTTMELTINGYKELPEGTVPVEKPKPASSLTYTFETDKDGKTVETDWRGWLPDSVTEHADFIKKNGQLSVQQGGQYIVYCADVVYDGGISVVVTQEPEDALDVWMQYDISEPEIMLSAGGTGHHVRVFKAAKQGSFDLLIAQKQSFNPNSVEYDSSSGVFAADENGTITDETPKTVIFSTELAVALMKHLTGQEPLGSVTGRTLDLNKDRILNAADLSILKMHLLNPGYSDAGLVLRGPSGNVPYKGGNGTKMDFSVSFQDEKISENLDLYHAVVELYSKDKNYPIITMQAADDALTWDCTLRLNIYEECDWIFYAKMTIQGEGEGAPVTTLHSNNVKVHFSNESDEPEVKALKLTTKWNEVGFGSKPQFKAELTDPQLIEQLRRVEVVLCDADTGNEICKMTQSTDETAVVWDGTPWKCTADLNIQEDKTVRFQAVITGMTNTVPERPFRAVSDVVSVHFCETPAP